MKGHLLVPNHCGPSPPSVKSTHPLESLGCTASGHIGAVPDQRVIPTTTSRRLPGVRHHARSQYAGRGPLGLLHQPRVWHRASGIFSA